METEKEFAKTLGKRIAIIRVHLDLTQDELGERIGCSGKYISQWESGKKLIPLKYIFQLCDTCNIPFEYFDPYKERELESITK